MFAKLILAACLATTGSRSIAVVLTFDDIASNGSVGNYYQPAYGVVFASGFRAVDHSGSDWGPPHSPNNVVVSNGLGFEFMLKWGHNPVLWPPYANSVGGYFSTQLGVVLEMTAYYSAPDEHTVLVGSVTIGSAGGQPWNNTYAQILGSPKPINIVRLSPLSEGALQRFCLDDVTIDFIPEPACLSALSLALAMGAHARRLGRRRR